MKVSMRVTKAYVAEIANVAEASTKLLVIASAMYMLIVINLLIKLNLVILCGLLVCSWHISGAVGQRSVASFIARVAETSL